LLQVRVLPDPPAYPFGNFFLGAGMEKVQDALQQAIEFFKESWQELKKVHWPSRKETYAATAVVIILVLIMVGYLALIDYALTRLIEAVVS
jgi:preprotein translocase subunit SecE